MMRIIVPVLLVFILQGCGIGYLDSYKTKTSTSTKYDAEEGYRDRRYTRKNIDLIKKSIANRTIGGAPFNKREADELEKRVSYSSTKNDAETLRSIQNYVTNYAKMLNDEDRDVSDAKKTVSNEYFNLDEYNRRRPLMNLAIVRRLSSSSIMPMSDETMDDFMRYYQANYRSDGHADFLAGYSYDATSDYGGRIYNVSRAGTRSSANYVTANMHKNVADNATQSYNPNKLNGLY